MKKKSKNYSFYLSKINKIEKTRKKNNKNWMDLLRLSLKLDFGSTSKILREICKEDKNISNLAQKIHKLNKSNEK